MRCVPIDRNYLNAAAGLWYHDPKVADDMLRLLINYRKNINPKYIFYYI